jgi:hypothetical protein
MSVSVFLRISEKVVLTQGELTFGNSSTDDSACRQNKYFYRTFLPLLLLLLLLLQKYKYLILPVALCPGVYSATNSNEYQNISLGLKRGYRIRLTMSANYKPTLYTMCGPQHSTALHGSKACCKDKFTFFLPYCIVFNLCNVRFIASIAL